MGTVQRTEESGRTTKNGPRVSKSPSVQVDGETSANSSDPSSVEDRRQRTVAICDVPDTVNESRIQAMAEKAGPVRKVILKTCSLVLEKVDISARGPLF